MNSDYEPIVSDRKALMTILVAMCVFFILFQGVSEHQNAQNNIEEAAGTDTAEPYEYVFVEEEALPEPAGNDIEQKSALLAEDGHVEDPYVPTTALQEAEPAVFLEDTARAEPVESAEAVQEKIAQQPEGLTTCRMKELGVEFTCDLTWEVHQDEEGHNTIVLSKDPYITLAFGQVDKNVVFLGQLSKMFFQKSGYYKDGFYTEQVEFAGRDAVLVKGFSVDNPDQQQRDFYYIHDGKLVRVMFMLSPKDRWSEGSEIIQEVMGTFASLP